MQSLKARSPDSVTVLGQWAGSVAIRIRYASTIASVIKIARNDGRLLVAFPDSENSTEISRELAI